MSGTEEKPAIIERIIGILFPAARSPQ